jgi:Fe-S oxidoreductase
MHEPNELVIILLDNGRREILNQKKDFSDLLYCIGCGNCLLDCPTYNTIGPSFGTDGMLGGRGVALSCLQRGIRAGVDDGLFLCTTCGLCGEVCPVGIDAGKRVKDLRKASLEDREVSPQLDEVTLLQHTIDQHGTPYGEMPRVDFSSFKKRSSLVLYIGCVGMSTETETAMHAIGLLQRIGIDFTIINEVCWKRSKMRQGQSPIRTESNRILRRSKRPGAERFFFFAPPVLKLFWSMMKNIEKVSSLRHFFLI